MEHRFSAFNIQVLKTLQTLHTAPLMEVVDRLGAELTDLLLSAKDVALTGMHHNTMRR